MIRRGALAAFARSLPGVTEEVLWENDLVFKVGGKMFFVEALDEKPRLASFKCTPESFAELIEQPGIIPAPYLARAHWVALQAECGLREKEVLALIRTSYDLVVAKLPKRWRP